jgi:anti-sigma B factor antagonist
VEDVGDVTVVNFVDKKILDEQNIQLIGDDLFRLVDELGRRKLVVSFRNVEFFSSAALGKILTLHRKMEAVKGRVVYCCIAKEIFEVFEIIKLDRCLWVTKTEEEALLLTSGRAQSRASCPTRDCRGQLRFRVEVNGAREATCAECRGVVRLPALPATGPSTVAGIEFSTYEGESVRATHSWYWWEIQAVGRLDMFAVEALERLWTTLPEPRRVLLDLTRVTELTRGGADSLARLVSTTVALAIVLTPATPLGELLPPASVFTDRNEAENHMKVRGASAPRLTVSVSLSE